MGKTTTGKLKEMLVLESEQDGEATIVVIPIIIDNCVLPSLTPFEVIELFNKLGVII